MNKSALILDLDFTLIHLGYVPGSIEVPGRTRSAWLAPQTVEILGELQARFEIVLATARSWDGTRWISDGLNERGVSVEKVVIEDGAMLGKIGDLRAFEPTFDAAKVRQTIGVDARFEWQSDFESCAVARCQTPDEAAHLMAIFTAQMALQQWNPRFYRDGRKVYILPQRANKWSALQQLLGERAAGAAGVGDGENDLVWLPNVARPATFSDAAPVLVDAVRARSGLVESARGHSGIQQILRGLTRRANAHQQR